MKPSAVLVVLQILLISCNTTEVPSGGEPVLRLAALDASCTEVWLEVKLAAGVQPRILTLQRDTTTILTTTLTAPETLIVDEGLLPNRQYTYTVTREAGLYPDRATSTITTMDTTSHNWTFSIDTLGDASSVLYDVAIINDTLAYAVGELYLRDSTGQLDPIRYNAAVWNGNTWSIRRVPYYFQGQLFYNPIQSAFVFSASDIWFCGNGVVRWNGVGYTEVPIPSSVWGPYRMNKIWGSSSSDLYIVGDGGKIAHYNGVTWQRIESGTTLDVYDIFGQRNSITGGLEVYAVAAKQFVTFERKILRLADNSVIAVSDSGIPYSLHGLWFKPGRRYFVVGSGMYAKYATTTPGPWRWLHPSVTQYYTYSVRGGQINDIAVCGAFGELLHFNGATWRSYRGQTGIGSGAYYGVAMKGNLIIAVGFESPRATVAVGTR